jgi:hypothetical protein
LTRFRRRRYLHAVPTGDWLRLRPKTVVRRNDWPQKLSFVACLVCGEVHEVRGETRFLRPLTYLRTTARRKKRRLAGLSAIRRMRYGYQADPNGT